MSNTKHQTFVQFSESAHSKQQVAKKITALIKQISLTTAAVVSLTAGGWSFAAEETQAATPATTTASVSVEQKVNINTATAEELAEGLKGVGPAKADAIIKFRELHGAFKTIDDLKQVSGIGDAMAENLSTQIIF
ncbi:MAG: ComEA family DNA-binding protein [Pseudomonadota bacterium]